MPKQGPRLGSRRAATTLWPRLAMACTRPMEVVVFPSPAGVGVMAASPLARMVVATPDADWSHIRSWWYAARRLRDRMAGRSRNAAIDTVRLFHGLDGWTPAQASLGFVLADPDVHCAVFATADPRHLHENAAASGRSLPPAVLQRLNASP